MGAGESTCTECLKEGVQVSDKPGSFKGWCQSCVKKQLDKDQLEIDELRDGNQHKKDKLKAELVKQKREAELELKEREAKLERENTRQDIEAKKASQLAQLQVQIEMNRTEYEKSKQLDETKGNEIKRKLEEEMNMLQIREKRVQIQAEEKIKKAELQEKSVMADLKAEFERQEREQSLHYEKESQDLNLKLKKQSAAFQQHAESERLEMEKEFAARTQATLQVSTSSGSTATVKMSKGIDPAIAALLIGVTNQPAIQQPQQPAAAALPPPVAALPPPVAAPPPLIPKETVPRSSPHPTEETGQQPCMATEQQ